MMGRRTCFVAAAFGWLACMGAAHAEEWTIDIVREPWDVAQQTCADALVASAPNEGPLVIKTVMHTLRERDSIPNSHEILDVGDHELNGSRDVLGVPFVIQDASHFLRYASSPLAQAQARSELFDGYVALAYGGFFQLFSREAAVTEPSHFEGRSVGGAKHAGAYLDFGGTLSPGLVMAMHFGPDYAMDVQGMPRHFPDMMEAPLLQAPALGLDRVARFVNLTFSRVHAVYFELHENTMHLPAPVRQRVVQWVRKAAVACSASNYDRERATLDQLRQAGLTVSPVDRRALAPTAWRWAFQFADGFRQWTLPELDAIYGMAATPQAGPPPSSVVQSPEERSQQEEFDRKVLQRRADHSR
jgi:hypothetical protein